MTQKISSLNVLISKLSKAEFQLKENLVKAVAHSTAKVQATAKSKFGHYQPAVGGFPAWKLLTLQTILEKINRGMNDANPLIGAYGKHVFQHANLATSRTAYPVALRDSILVKNFGLVGVVGTNNPLARHHEFGAPRANIPPRPFIRPALFQEQGFIQTEFRKAILKTLKEM
jgi:phage gpG-like protein